MQKFGFKNKPKLYLLIAFITLAFVSLPIIVLLQQQSTILTSSALAQCPGLPNETPEPQQTTVATTSETTLQQLQPGIDQEQKKVQQNNRDGAAVQRLSDKLNQRKRSLRKLMRHHPEKALVLMRQSTATSQLHNVMENCVEEPAQIQGDLAAYIVEYTGGKSSTEYLLQTADQTIQLHIANELKRELKSGMQLRVSGYQLDNTILVDAGNPQALTILSEGAKFSAAQTTKKLTLVLANFNNTSLSIPSASTLQNQTIPAIANYYEKISYGKFSIEASVLDWRTLSISPTCDIATSVNAGLQSSSNQMDWNNTAFFLLAAPFAQSCGWEGISSIGPQRILTPNGIKNMGLGLVRVNNGSISTSITAHELGHQLGAGHAGFANCGNNVLSGTCDVVIYGDLYDVMGNALSMGMMSAYHLEKMGWMDSTNMQTVTTSGTFTLLPLSSDQPGTKALKIPQSNPEDTWYIEYRQPTGADAVLQAITGTNVFEGVLLHKTFTTDADNAPDGILIDPSPPSNALTAALPVNSSLTLPGTNITVKTLPKIGSNIQVQVSIAGTPEPTALPTQPTGGSGTRLGLTLLLHGIGKGGDNVTPQSTGSTTITNPQRSVTVDIYNASNQLVASQQGTVTFNTSQGNFQGVIPINNLPTGMYLIKLKINQYLRNSIPGIQQITSSAINNLPSVALVTGDINNDNQLTIADYNLILECFSDIAPAQNCDASKKLAADITDDSKVNQFDYNLFLRELSVQTGE